MNLFSRKPLFCTVCNVQLTHRHKPKREWGIEGRLCGKCHLDKTREHHEAKAIQECIVCKKKDKIMNLWEPRWQWDMEGLLCKTCFDEKEQTFKVEKNFCSVCGEKLGFIRYNPKSKWKVTGQLCRKCWDEQKAENE